MDALGSQSIQEGRGRPQEGGTAGMPRSGKRNGLEKRNLRCDTNNVILMEILPNPLPIKEATNSASPTQTPRDCI
ncbi:hypothetical protein VTN49DRAFT_1910 [Thermomyces lanuginosus]|uniref:uncharacterized protein n=1 Tax=Thermomyces lanuginosus TaxID=5541 RepID=UPI0037445FCD